MAQGYGYGDLPAELYVIIVNQEEAEEASRSISSKQLRVLQN